MDVQTKIIQKLQIEVILLSLVLVVGAMMWTWQIGMSANGLDHRLDHSSEDLRDLKHSISMLEVKHA